MRKKVINIRKSLVAGALSVTTLLTGLGLLKSCNSNDLDTSTIDPDPTSQTIFDDEYGKDQGLPGGAVTGSDTSTDDPTVTKSGTGISAETKTDGELPETGSQDETKTPGISSETDTDKTIGDNQGVTDTDVTPTGSADTTEKDTSVTEPGEETPAYEHKLGEWVILDDDFEANYCPDDGTLMATRNHEFEVTDTKYVANNDGTHNVIITGTCINCGHTKTIVKENIECQDITMTWDSTYEYGTCNDCEYTYTIGKHEFNKGVIKGDKVIYTCEHDGCEYTYTRDYNPGYIPGSNDTPTVNPGDDTPIHVHYLGEWVSVDDEYEENYCPDDGTLMGVRSHNYGITDTTKTSNHDGTHNVVRKDSCVNCGHTKTTSTINEFCGYNTTYSYQATDDGHHISLITEVCGDCSYTINSSSIEDTCNFVLTGTTTDENGDIIETYSCSDGCGNSYTYTRTSKPVEPEKIDVAAAITVDQDSLSFTYDGEPHFPVISGLPDGVTARYISEKGVNAGEYIWHIEFDVPEGYVADPIDISYTIKPAKVSCTYEYSEETGTFNAVYSGLAASDIIDISHTVNGKDITSGNPTEGSMSFDDFGVYKVQSSLEIDPEKAGNYDFEGDINKSSVYQVKRDNTWFDIDTVAKVENGNVVVDVFLSADKLPYVEGCAMPALVFNVYFDTNQLGVDVGTLYENAYGWDGMANPLNYNNPDVENCGYGVVVSPDWDNFEYFDGLPERLQICQLTFTQLDPEAKDVVIKIDDAQIGTGDDELYPFEFKTDASVCVVNPSNPDMPINIITREGNDLLDDAVYLYEDVGDEEDKTAALEKLQEYIELGFQFSDDELEESEGLGDNGAVGDYIDDPDYQEPDAPVIPASAESIGTLQNNGVGVNIADSVDVVINGQGYTLFFDASVQDLSEENAQAVQVEEAAVEADVPEDTKVYAEPMKITIDGQDYTLYFDSPVGSLDSEDFARVLK